MQRWTSTNRCVVCGGHQGARPNCWGFLSGDGLYAHCTREECAGSLERHDGSNAFVHFLGESGCDCGETHHGAEGAARAQGTKPPRDEGSARRQIEKILNGCERFPTGIIRYLQGRGLRPKKIVPNALRYHPALPYFDEDGDPMSALLAAALALAFSATTGPATPTVAGQTRTTNPQQTYVFSSHETGVATARLRFRCAVDSAALRPCATKTVLHLTPGKHALAVQAVDPAGHASTTRRVTILVFPPVRQLSPTRVWQKNLAASTGGDMEPTPM